MSPEGFGLLADRMPCQRTGCMGAPRPRSEVCSQPRHPRILGAIVPPTPRDIAENSMPQPDSASAQEQRRDLCLRVKQLRDAAGLTQQDFAAELSRSRAASEQRRTFTRNKVNRVENGHAAVDLVLAHALDEYALTRDLPGFDFVSLVAGVGAAELDNARGRELRHLLGTRSLDEIQIVMCDLTDFAFYVTLTPLVPRLDLTVLMPTAARVQALFGTGRAEAPQESYAFGDYADRLTEHLWRQVRLFHRIASGRDGFTLRLLQSHIVFNSMAAVRHGRHVSCVFWPPVPADRSHSEPDVAPSIGDASVASWYARQIEQRAAEASNTRSATTHSLQLSDTFLMAESLPASAPAHRSRSQRFLQFHRRGVHRGEIDAERAVAAFALLLPFVHSVSEGIPSIELLFRSRAADVREARPASRLRLSFFSAWVTASAAWQALNSADYATSEGPTPGPGAGTSGSQAATAAMAQSRRHPVEQSRDFMARLSEYQSSGEADEDRSTAAVLDRARRIALCDELEQFYGLERSVAESRLEGTHITDFRVRKDAGADILARIYCLELNPGERDRIVGSAGRYRPGSIAMHTMREVRSMMADFSQARSEHEFSDCLGLALGHDVVQPGFTELLDALESSDPSAVDGGTLSRGDRR